MAGPLVLIFHRHAADDEPLLVRLLDEVRRRLADRQAGLFRRAGAGEVRLVDGLDSPFGLQLAEQLPRRGGLVILGSGAVARLAARDARRLVEVAAAGGPQALTNNRYSSDVCAVGDSALLRELPPLPSDNALPRWLEERAGFDVAELPGRERLALDIDTPLDACLWALVPQAPRWIGELLVREGLSVPRMRELRAIAADPAAELLVFGRAGSATLRWLERNVRCRVRLLAEERGLRASSPLAIGGPSPDGPPRSSRDPRASLGLLLDERGPEALAPVVAELADGAIIDSRVLIAHHFGADEGRWPSSADRFASDLLRADDVSDPWLSGLTQSAAASAVPILLGAHSLVGPGVALLLRGAAGTRPVRG